MKITHVYHKKNEKFEIEFFQDKECTESFHFKDKENLYIELRDGDVTPLLALKNAVATWIKIYTPYLWKQFKYQEPLNKITTLEDITPDFSKYIPKDSVVLFLSQAKGRKYGRAMGLNWFYWFYWFNQDDDSIDCQFISHSSVSEEETEDEKKLLEDFYNLPTNDYSMFKNITLFIPEINSQNIEQLNNIAKELKEKYNVEWVGLCVRDCFQCIYERLWIVMIYLMNTYKVRILTNEKL